LKSFAAISLILAGCTTAIEQPTLLAEVLDDSSAHHDKAIRVCGLLVDGIEQCSLWEHAGTPLPDTPGAFIPPGIAWLAVPGERCAPGNNNPMGGDPPVTMWVVVSGIFQTGERYGHLDEYDHQIVVEKIEPSSFMCGRQGGT
jgi:hypothetical protein